MSSSCACIDVWDAEPCAFGGTEYRTAKTSHKCGECGREIARGERYERAHGMWDGEFEHYKTCLDCCSIRDTFYCNWMYGQIFEDLRGLIVDTQGEGLPWSEFHKLTPKAREIVYGMIEDVWADLEEE